MAFWEQDDMRAKLNRQTASFGPTVPAITPQQLDRAIAEGRRLHGLAVRRAFAAAGRHLSALPAKLAARLRSPGHADPCYRPAR